MPEPAPSNHTGASSASRQESRPCLPPPSCCVGHPKPRRNRRQIPWLSMNVAPWTHPPCTIAETTPSHARIDHICRITGRPKPTRVSWSRQPLRAAHHRNPRQSWTMPTIPTTCSYLLPRPFSWHQSLGMRHFPCDGHRSLSTGIGPSVRASMTAIPEACLLILIHEESETSHGCNY